MNLLDHFEGVRGCGANTGQFMAKCPAHDDHNHSLSIGRGDGRWLLYCQAGCWAGKVLGCSGLDWEDLFDDPRDARDSGRVSLSRLRAPRRKLDMSGDAMLPPEHIIDFWHEQLTGALARRLRELKGWHEAALEIALLGWDGVRITMPVYGPGRRLVSLVRYLPGGDPKTLCVGPRELYPAPELYGDEELWLVEGEPDRVSGIALSLFAVGIPGVGKFNENWPQRFQGRKVTVCLDCDEQGRDAARKWASALSSAGVENRVVDLDPNRTDGTDIGDMLAVASRQGRVGDLRAYLHRLHAEAWV